MPKHPGMQGYNAASECTDNMCEEGMHIGGFYQPGGRGYTGQFFHGVIDEVRVWPRPRTVVEINMFMAVPLRPSLFNPDDRVVPQSPPTTDVKTAHTDFDGTAFLKNTLSSKKLDKADLKKYAPNIVDGTEALKDWSNSL